MDIHEIRQMLRTRSIYDIPLRVTYYARVSSESDEQLNSLDNQVNYYEDLIKKNKNWNFVEGYIDEGISGISTRHRENFNRMIDDATRDKFDLVITKEISRFARNTLDSIQYTRQLLSSGVGVFFQNDNINTFDEDSELRLSIMSSIAQDELRKLSSRVKFGQQQAIKNGVVIGNSRIFGYQKNDKKLVVDEEEAVMVRELFELYATGKYSMKQIENIFWEKGYRNHNNKKIAHTTMSNIIANPKYKGYYVGNKVKIIDMFTKKQKFLPPEEWVMFKDETGEIVPAIVSEELWEQANSVLKRRSDDVKYRKNICNHANLLTGKLFCANCGVPYYRRSSVNRQGQHDNSWVCSAKIKNGKNACDSFTIYESDISKILFEVFRNNGGNSAKMLKAYEHMYESLMQDGSLQKKIKTEEARIELSNKKKSKLLDLVTDGNISDSDFRELVDRCNKEIAASEQELAELKSRQNSSEEFRQHMNEIRAALKAAERDVSNGTITKEFIDAFVDKILVTPIDKNKMQLDIKIFTGENSQKYLEKLKRSTPKSSTGQTSRKMIEAYENGIK